MSNIDQHFNYVQSENKSKCLAPGCAEQLNGKIKTNWWRHLEAKHNSIYLSLEPRKTTKAKIAKQIPNVLLTIRKSCVELVTINGRPFAHINDSGLRNVMKAAASVAEDSDNSLDLDIIDRTINLLNLFKDIDAVSCRTMHIISEEAKDRYISLMVDIVSKRGRSVLGINVQYFHEESRQLVIRTIGMVRMLMPHTGQYISDLIKRKLAEYRIETRQIYSVTTDNGANVVKSNQILQSQLNESGRNVEPFSTDSLDLNNTAFDDALVDLITTQEYDDTDGDDNNIEYGDENENDEPGVNALYEFQQSFLSDTAIESVNGILCGAHTLQLAVNSAIKKWNIRTGILTKCRAIAVKLRNQNLRDEILLRKLLLPLLDCSTRWNSIYSLIERLVQLREFVGELASRKWRPKQAPPVLSNDEWTELEICVKILKLPYRATLDMQSTQYTLSEFYGTWFILKMKMEEFKGFQMAKDIIQGMSKREKGLLDTPPVLCNVFLDPRYQAILSIEEQDIAIDHLRNLHQKIHSNTEINLDVESNDEHYDDLDKLAFYMGRSPYQKQAIDLALERLRLMPRERYRKINFFEYWYARRNQEPLLYELVEIIVAAAPTQTSVERAFSALSFILNPLRSQISDHHLEAVLIIRLNPSLFKSATDALV